jgi:hypothetical protein
MDVARRPRPLADAPDDFLLSLLQLFLADRHAKARAR